MDNRIHKMIGPQRQANRILPHRMIGPVNRQTQLSRTPVILTSAPAPIVELHQSNLTVAVTLKNLVEPRNLTAVHSLKISVCPITSHKMRLHHRTRRMQHQVDKQDMLPILTPTLRAIAHILRRGTESQPLESLIRRQESPRPVRFH